MPTNRKKLTRHRKVKLSKNLIKLLLTGDFDYDEPDSFDIFLLMNDLSKMRELWESNKEILEKIWLEKYNGEGKKMYVEERLRDAI